jgi:hypothetical protein
VASYQKDDLCAKAVPQDMRQAQGAGVRNISQRKNGKEK